MDFFGFLGFLSKLIRLLLKVTKVTTRHQKWPKMGQNSIISSFFARRAKKASAKGGSPPQELEVGPHSRPYLLVVIIGKILAYVAIPKAVTVEGHDTRVKSCLHLLCVK